ncbi:YezD family protein [Thermoanaerobacterium thermosaccharolyticum]|uniref:Uncharacterized small protein (DUF2292) n=1 Tax=Thermoanaerobacterium thermosaccharolyticum M0795 TaxID=698948 RepID=L0IMM2_THETR|nr:YezD family protein [Thermoanaerobacterium thermosaccharolyticum]AGB19217.1 Uncharacterized small protein (DUF2292) [Thermoanaerobacterium thermosaccharolyticum M0795]
MERKNADNERIENKPLSNEIKKLLELIDEVKYGSIIIIINNGKIVQIEKNEKMRLV